MKQGGNMSVFGIVFAFVIMLVVFVGVNYYITRRTWQAIEVIFSGADRLIEKIIFVFLVLLLLLGFVRSMLPLPSPVKNVLGAVSMYWMGIFIYLIMFFALSDVILLACRMTKIISNPMSANIRLYTGIAVYVLTALTVCYGICNAKQIDNVAYAVELNQSKLDGELNMVVVSDLHLGALGSEARIEEMVEDINGMNPDIVCIAGDIFDNDYYAVNNPEKVASQLKTIKSKYGVYACPGNHDAGSTVDEQRHFLERSNVIMLNDKAVVIDNRFTLVGRLDGSPIGGYGGLERAETEAVLENIDSNLPVIVMDHNPIHIEEYGDKVDLIVSGHTHMGQLFPFNIVTHLMYTVDYGYYRKDDNSPHVIVTSGVGTWGMPMRVGTDCEIINIKLN